MKGVKCIDLFLLLFFFFFYFQKSHLALAHAQCTTKNNQIRRKCLKIISWHYFCSHPYQFEASILTAVCLLVHMETHRLSFKQFTFVATVSIHFGAIKTTNYHHHHLNQAGQHRHHQRCDGLHNFLLVGSLCKLVYFCH